MDFSQLGHRIVTEPWSSQPLSEKPLVSWVPRDYALLSSLPACPRGQWSLPHADLWLSLQHQPAPIPWNQRILDDPRGHFNPSFCFQERFYYTVRLLRRFHNPSTPFSRSDGPFHDDMLTQVRSKPFTLTRPELPALPPCVVAIDHRWGDSLKYLWRSHTWTVESGSASWLQHLGAMWH